MNKNLELIIIVFGLALAGCTSTDDKKYKLEESYLKSDDASVTAQQIRVGEDNSSNKEQGFINLPPLVINETSTNDAKDLADMFSDQEMVEISASELPLPSYLHYVFGELFGVNYVLSESAKSATQSITLNIQKSISKRRLFLLTREVLGEKGFFIRFDEELFYINNESTPAGGSAIAYGYGQNPLNVPESTGDIIQFVPFKYGINSSITLVLPSIANVKVIPDNLQNMVMLQGRHSEIRKAIEFISMVDRPVFRERYVGAYKSTFIDIKDVIGQLNQLLKGDGYNKPITTVTLEAQSTLVFFASDSEVVARVRFWLEKLDVPADTDEKQYYVYTPKYARATDLLESLMPLIGGGSGPSSNANNSTERNSNTSTGSGRQRDEKRAGLSARNENISVVVDERSNSLIVHSSGKEYKALLPLIERLDVLPKQVMLEVVIAEVTLTDQFKRGVEFFLTENNFTLGTQGAFALDKIGGLSYALTGSNNWDVKANFQEEDSKINILSRPSLVVRDGITATMQVGTDIPIVSSTSSPDVGTTTSVQYRKTGLTIEVTPTVNSQGVVTMEINQQISNVVEGGITAEGAPSIFDRAMTTEVVANSGQTIILGGLISENNNQSNTKVPVLGDIPVVGGLFSSESDAKDKTELVIVVTPRIIESDSQWKEIKATMANQLQQIDFIE